MRIWATNLWSIFLTSVFLSPVLLFGWNFGIAQLSYHLSQIDWLTAMVILATFQTLSVSILRKRDITYIPIYLPMVQTDTPESANQTFVAVNNQTNG